MDRLLVLGSLVVAEVSVALILVLQDQYFCQEAVSYFLERGGSSPATLTLPQSRGVDDDSFAVSANDYHF